MSYSSLVSSKGRVTVPQEIRTRLGLREGDRLEFVIDGDRTIIRPARSGANVFEEFAGVLETFPGGAAEINAWVGNLREDESQRR
ncbi:MAG: AbrB/MazE/SpoVT family DNA-binding domain-containing protein [Acidobacteriota bacterium]